MRGYVGIDVSKAHLDFMVG